MGWKRCRKVEEHSPDLILLDIMMPHMSGFQVCKKLKGDPRTKDIQISNGDRPKRARRHRARHRVRHR